MAAPPPPPAAAAAPQVTWGQALCHQVQQWVRRVTGQPPSTIDGLPGVGAGIVLSPAAVSPYWVSALQHHSSLPTDLRTSICYLVGRGHSGCAVIKLSSQASPHMHCMTTLFGPLVQHPGCYSELDLDRAQVKLADFGRSLSMHQKSEWEGCEEAVVWGQPGYRAPEVRGALWGEPQALLALLCMAHTNPCLCRLFTSQGCVCLCWFMVAGAHGRLCCHSSWVAPQASTLAGRHHCAL
jgi:hypothetical protein